MKFSEQWLRTWVNPPVGTEELAEQLTMAGLEVDAITPVAETFHEVVVGEVLEVAPHPDADKLRVCRVDVGTGAPLQIVCGAPNVQVGMKAPTARVGAMLPGGLKIKRAKLRGIESSGMLCSARELGLFEDAEGLLALPADAPVGKDLRDYLGLEDVTIELGLTPNRSDCLSISGIARETAALNGLPFAECDAEPVTAAVASVRPVRLEAGADCPRYAGRVIEDVDPGAPTPLWMQERLRRSGLRSLGPLVDVTNYVMLELGQPMHAFDIERLSGGITVRHAAEDERLTLLDGEELALTAGSLVIADDVRPLALAGVMGGRDTGVGATTRHVFLESAYFRPEAIAGRARAYGLHTDSSHRFERGVAPDLQRRALERATRLLLEIAGGRPGPVVEETLDDQLPVRESVRLRRARIERVLGLALPDDRVETILGRLGMGVHATDEGWSVSPPAFRFDIEREEDLIEELARVHGYEAVPVTRPLARLPMAPRAEGRVGPRRVRSLLADRGYQEAVTYSFVSPELQTLVDPEVQPLRLANPISADLGVMRTSLWAGLLGALVHNVKRQQGRVRLFELGLSFRPQGDDLIQAPQVAGIAYGAALPEQWGLRARPADFFDVKGDVETLLGLTGRADFVFKPEHHPALHPGQSARVLLDEQPVGWLGVLHPAAERQLELTQPAVLFELALDALDGGHVPEFQSLSRFPAIRRDLAVIVEENVSAHAVRCTVTEAEPTLLQDFELFDVYRGKGIDSGRKSLAIGLTFQDLSRTLTDADVEGAVERVVRSLQERLGATLRG